MTTISRYTPSSLQAYRAGHDSRSASDSFNAGCTYSRTLNAVRPLLGIACYGLCFLNLRCTFAVQYAGLGDTASFGPPARHSVQHAQVAAGASRKGTSGGPSSAGIDQGMPNVHTT
jgi:hypothetical protein